MRLIAILIIIIMVSPLFCFVDTTTDSTIDIQESQIEINDVETQPLGFLPASAPDTYNRIPNGGFEDWIPERKPSLAYWIDYEEKYHWYAESPWPVKDDNRSLGFQARTVEPFDGNDGVESIPPMSAARWYSIFSPDATLQNLTLNLDWWIDQNINNETGGDVVFLQLSLNIDDEFVLPTTNLYYFLSCSEWELNPWGGKFHVGGSHQQWNALSRNITDDFIAAGGDVELVDNPIVSMRLDFQIVLSGGSLEYVRAFFDNLRLGNETHPIIDGANNNGNFETDSVWSHNFDHDVSIIGRSPVATEGDWSLNTTIESQGNETELTIQSYPDVRVTNQSKCPLHLDWRIETFSSISSTSLAYLHLSCQNYTTPFNVYYMLGYGGASSPISNSTENLVIHVNEFNTTGSWNSLDRILYDDIVNYFGSNDSTVTITACKIGSEDQGAKLTVLWDDLSILSTSINDGDFEDQGAVGTSIHGWGLNYNPPIPYEDPLVTVTDLAYSGESALNLSVADGTIGAMSTTPAYLEVREDEHVYLDLMWRLEEFDVSATCYVGFIVSFSHLNDMWAQANIGGFAYIIGSYEWTPSSWYFGVDGVNTTGSWVNMKRNLYEDMDAVNYWLYYDRLVIDSVSFFAFTSSGCSVQLLLDNISVYSDPLPEITHYEHDSEEAGLPTTVRATVTDNNLQSVVLHYRADYGEYSDVVMDYEIGNNYTAMIPGHFHGTRVEYYISAHDIHERSVDTLVFLYYTPPPDSIPIYSGEIYYASDTLLPTVTILNPVSGDTCSGTVTIEVSASDFGSDISQLEILVGISTIFISTDQTDTFSWNTRTFVNGSYTLHVIATDGAGNENSTSVSINVSNPESPEPTTTGEPPPVEPPPLFMVLLIGSLAVVVILVGVFFKIRK